MSSWLIDSTLSMSVLILLVLGLRPLVRYMLGAQAAYLLWLLIPAHLVLPEIPYRPEVVADLVNRVPAVASAGFSVSPSTTLPWLAIWVLGLAAWSGLRFWRQRTFQRRANANCSPLEVNQLPPTVVAELSGFTGRVVTTSLASAPFASGLTNPRIFLPDTFTSHFSAAQQRWIIRHERAHLSRGDLWVQLLAECLRAAFWFNPLVHLAANAVRTDQELACDQAVIGNASNAQRIEYGKTLLQGSAHASGLIETAFFTTHKERYRMISRHKHSATKTLLSYALVATLGGVALSTSPAVMAGALDDKAVSLNFQQIEATKLLTLIGDYVGVRFEGIDQLQDLRVDVSVQDVSAREALAAILHCRGYALNEQSDTEVAIVVSEAPAAEC